MIDSEIIIYLKKLCGYDVELPNHPHCRFSELLHKINNPKYELSFTYPVCRIEEYLLDIVNGTMKMLDETPRSNIEMFLAVKIGRTDIALPKPMSEIDWWLNEWLKAIKDIYIELNGAVDYTVNETFAGDLVIKEIAGNTVQDVETNIVPTPQRPVPVVSKKITVKKLSLNVFPLEKESDLSKIPDNGTYRSIMEHELKPNTAYKFSYSSLNVPAKSTLSFRVSSHTKVLENIFTKMNFGTSETVEPSAEIVFTTDSDGRVKFEYNCNVDTSTTTETFQQYWYTKITNDIVLKEDAEPIEELVQLKSLKESENLFDLGLFNQIELIGDENLVGGGAIKIPIKLKPQTKYKISFDDSMVPSKSWVILNMQDSTKKILCTLVSIKNTSDSEVEIPSKNITITTPVDGNIYFYYHIQEYDDDGKLIIPTFETVCRKWFTKYLKNIMLTEVNVPQTSYIQPPIRDYKIVNHTNKRAWLVRNIQEVNLNDLTYSYAGGNGVDEGVRFYAPVNPTLKHVGEIYCNVFPSCSNYRYDLESAYGGNSGGGKTLSIVVKDSNITEHTQEALLDYINNANAVAYYALETSIIEEIKYLENDNNEDGYSFQDDSSPSPAIPSPPTNVRNIAIKTCGKNLIDYTKLSFFRANLVDKIVTSNIENHYYSNAFILGNPFVNKKSITFSVLPLQAFNRHVSILAFYDGGYIEKNSDDGIPYVTLELPNDKTISHFELRFNRSRERFTDTSSKFSDFQIEIADIATQYQSYKETSVSYTLAQPLLRIGSYTDTIDITNSNVNYLNKRIILSGKSDEGWELGSGANVISDKTIRFVIIIKDCKPTITGLTNNLKNLKNSNINNDVEGAYFETPYNDQYFRIRINKNRLESFDVAGLKKWLKDNPITLSYVLNNPVVAPLESDLVEELKILKSFDNVTNVICQNIPKYSNLKFEIRVKSQASSMLCLRSGEDV